MSATPVKSQSPHNFSSLSFPTWGTHNATSDAASKAEPDANRVSSPTAVPHRGVGSRSSRQQRFSFSTLAPSSLKTANDSQKGMKETAEEENQNGGKPPQGEHAFVKKENEEEGEEEEEEVRRTWNLRPRKGLGCSKKNGVFSPSEMCRGGDGVAQESKQRAGGTGPKSNRLRELATESPVLGGGERKNEKAKLWIALSRDETEEDIFIMTGNRPSRRPRKRPKNVQKQLDNVFPGLWLVGMTADCYRVTDAPVKK